jgi:hypothetical protein
MNIKSCDNCANKTPDCNAIPRVEGTTCYLFTPKPTLLPGPGPDHCHALLEALRDTHRHIEELEKFASGYGGTAARDRAKLLTKAIIAQAGRDNKTRET